MKIFYEAKGYDARIIVFPTSDVRLTVSKKTGEYVLGKDYVSMKGAEKAMNAICTDWKEYARFGGEE